MSRSRSGCWRRRTAPARPDRVVIGSRRRCRRSWRSRSNLRAVASHQPFGCTGGAGPNDEVGMKLRSILRGEISPGFTILVVISTVPFLGIQQSRSERRLSAELKARPNAHGQPPGFRRRGAVSKIRHLSYHTEPAPSSSRRLPRTAESERSHLCESSPRRVRLVTYSGVSSKHNQ